MGPASRGCGRDQPAPDRRHRARPPLRIVPRRSSSRSSGDLPRALHRRPAARPPTAGPGSPRRSRSPARAVRAGAGGTTAAGPPPRPRAPARATAASSTPSGSPTSRCSPAATPWTRAAGRCSCSAASRASRRPRWRARTVRRCRSKAPEVISSARASWPSTGLVMSDHCLRTTSSSRTPVARRPSPAAARGPAAICVCLSERVCLFEGISKLDAAAAQASPRASREAFARFLLWLRATPPTQVGQHYVETSTCVVAARCT